MSKFGLRNWAGETLTETLIEGQARPSEQARRIVQPPSSSIRPDCSAIGTKTDGGSGPNSGRFQRSSASTPTIARLSASKTGW